jgi:ketosteroid isomerase-like protein
MGRVEADASAPTGGEHVTSNRAGATVRQFVAAINTHDPPAIVALCAADHVLVDSLGTCVSGPLALERGWAGYFLLFPDYRIELDALVARGELVLACGWAGATHAPSRIAWRIPAAWRAVVRRGRVAVWQVYADNKPVHELLARSPEPSMPAHARRPVRVAPG